MMQQVKKWCHCVVYCLLHDATSEEVVPLFNMLFSHDGKHAWCMLASWLPHSFIKPIHWVICGCVSTSYKQLHNHVVDSIYCTELLYALVNHSYQIYIDVRT